MKNSLSLGVGFLALLANPAWADLRTMTMSGHGEVKAVPDQAQISAGVATNAPTAAAALATNNARMNAVYAALKKLGVPDRNIQTSGFSVFPQYTTATTTIPAASPAIRSAIPFL